MNIFEYLSYKTFLKDLVKERKKVSSKFTFSHLADVMRVQKTYLSQVLANSGDLNSDQIFLLSEHLQLNADESEYLSLLVELSRTGLAKRKKQLMTSLKERQQKHLRMDLKITAKAFEPAVLLNHTEFFLNPYNSIVQVYLTLPAFQRQPLLLTKELGLSKEALLKILALLHDLKLIRYTPGAPIPVEVLERTLHSVDSQALTVTQQILFRAMTLDKLIRIPREKRYGAHVTFSADYETFVAFKAEFQEFMARCQKKMEGCEPTEVYHLNFDLFPLKEEG